MSLKSDPIQPVPEGTIRVARAAFRKGSPLLSVGPRVLAPRLSLAGLARQPVRPAEASSPPELGGRGPGDLTGAAAPR
jgi:hypothetical protein